MPAANTSRTVRPFAVILIICFLAFAAVGSAADGDLTVNILGPSQGQSLTQSVKWEAEVTGGSPSRVEFFVDGSLRWTERTRPYVFNGDSGKLTPAYLGIGTHQLKVVAYRSNGAATSSVTVSVPGEAAPAVRIVSPAEGQSLTGAVRFEAATTGATPSRIEFFVDDRLLWIERSAPYVFNGDTGTLSPAGLAVGNHALKVVAYSSSGASSSSASVTVSIPAPPASTRTNLAASGQTSASSTDSPALQPSNAVDGSQATRWSSSWNDNQWWQVDLGAVRSLDAVSINWESAYPSKYIVKGSADGVGFIDLAVVTPDGAGRQDTSFPARSARFVRIVGVDRATAYGISAWDVQVYGSSSPIVTTGAPVATTPPSVTGSLVQGSTLKTSAGTWSGTPTDFAYGWVRCAPNGDSCDPIAGATAQTYNPVAADVSATLRSKVTATNAGGSTIAFSTPTGTINPVAVVNGSLGTSLPARLGASTGQQFYVDGQSGSDSNPGTMASPWRTIGKAWSAVPLAGSIINVRAGTYTAQSYLSNRSASATNPITIRAFPGENVLLQNTGSVGAAVFLSRASGVRIQGFRISNPASDGIKVSNSSDIELVGNWMYGNGNQGIIVGGGGTTAPTYSKNVQIWSNRIYNSAARETPYEHGIYYGNTDSDSDGIQHGTVGGVIANNVFYDHHAAFHIQVGSQADGVIVTNNTFATADSSNANLGNAIQIWGLWNAYTTKNVVIVNNVIANNANRGVHGAGPSMPTNIVRNNLAHNNPMGDFVPKWGTSTIFTLGSGNITGLDPRFVDPANKDYRLRADSPAVGRADPAYAPPTDINGDARLNTPDLGAFERTG